MNIILDNMVFFISSTLIIGYLLLSLKKTKEEYLYTKEQFNSVKAICAILIVFHHISEKMSNNILILPFEEIGKYAVAVFFMISGYGIMFSFIKNKSYLNKFISNRFIKIYIPFLITNILFILIKILNYEKFSFKEIIYYVLGIKLIDSTMWFIITLLLLDIVFYILFKNLSVKNAINGLLVFTLVYFLIGLGLGFAGHRLDTILSFFIGVALAYKKEEFGNVIKKKYILNLISLCFLCFIFRIVAFLVSNVLLNLVMLNISTILFSIFIISLGVKFKFDSRIISFLGSISFEIYLLHMKVIYLFQNLNKSITAFIAFGIVIIGGSYILNKINRFIIRYFNNLGSYYERRISN